MDYNIFEEDFFKYNVLGENGLLLKSENNYSKLDQIKKFLISILNDKLKKSFENLFFDMNEELLIKGKSYPVGTIREWQGKRFKKISKGKWMRSYSEGEKSTGENIAIAKTIKKIQNAKSISELAQIVRDNKSRFEGKDGKIHPTVKQILGIAKEKKSENKKNGNKKTFDEWKAENRKDIDKWKKKNPEMNEVKKIYDTSNSNDFDVIASGSIDEVMAKIQEKKGNIRLEKISNEIIARIRTKNEKQPDEGINKLNKYNKKIIEDLKKQDLETLKRSIDGIEWNFKKGQEKLKELIEKKKNLEKEKLGEFQKQHYEKIKKDIEKYQKGLGERESALKEFRKILEEKQIDQEQKEETVEEAFDGLYKDVKNREKN